MNLLQYTLRRMASRELENSINSGIENSSKNHETGDVPSLWMIFLLPFSYLFIALILYIIKENASSTAFNVSFTLTGLFLFLGGVMMLFLKSTYGYKQESFKTPDKRYKSGFRTEAKRVPDYTLIIPYSNYHRTLSVLTGLEILILLIGLIYLFFIVLD